MKDFSITPKEMVAVFRRNRSLIYTRNDTKGICKAFESSFIMDQTFNLWTKLAFVREELIAQNPFDDARSQLNEITLSNSLINSYPFTGCQTLADLTDR